MNPIAADRALIRRAAAAWLRGPEASGRPFPDRSKVIWLKEKGYVALHSQTRLLGVYRVRPDGVLRLMKRPPKAIQ